MDRRVIINSKRKRNENKIVVSINPKLGDLIMSKLKIFLNWRAEPVSVAKLWDDLLLGVKG